MLGYLDNMQDPEELRALAVWKVHTLTGDRKGTWSLSVTRNLRLTFRINFAEWEICDVNLEDYHLADRRPFRVHQKSSSSRRLYSDRNR